MANQVPSVGRPVTTIDFTGITAIGLTGGGIGPPGPPGPPGSGMSNIERLNVTDVDHSNTIVDQIFDAFNITNPTPSLPWLVNNEIVDVDFLCYARNGTLGPQVCSIFLMSNNVKVATINFDIPGAVPFREYPIQGRIRYIYVAANSVLISFQAIKMNTSGVDVLSANAEPGEYANILINRIMSTNINPIPASIGVNFDLADPTIGCRYRLGMTTRGRLV